MSLPALTDWESTVHSLHRAAQVMGVLRKSFTLPQPNALHLTLRVVPEGVSTGPLSIGTLTLNFATASIAYQATGADSRPVTVMIPLASQTPKMLALRLTQEIARLRPDQTMRVLPNDHDSSHLFKIDTGLGADYASVLYTLFTGLARFRARISGMMTPAVIWPHHFDLSMLWFAGPGSDEHTDPHINLGFAPFSDGFARPYLYAYAWPLSKATTHKLLPPPARWHRGAWHGVVVDYDVLRETLSAGEPPALRIEALYEEIFTTLADTLGQEPASPRV